jgi:hypothetical protein
VEVNVDGDTTTHSLEWELPDARMAAAWANTDDAVRDGAYIVALATVHLKEGMRAIRRAEKLVGADYYVAPADVDETDLENSFRLEVSGTEGAQNDVLQRLSQKKEQTRRGRSDLPAIAAVVGFKVAIVLIAYVT